MEFVWLTTDQLNAVASGDIHLRNAFVGTMACDQLPEHPEKLDRRAYIVNTDPSHLPGQHWLGVWTEHDTCEVLDSYGLPFSHYEHLKPFIAWLNKWSCVRRNDAPIQPIKTASCGDYALVYLMYKARGKSTEEFLELFSEHDLVSNDDKVGDILEDIVKNEIKAFE